MACAVIAENLLPRFFSLELALISHGYQISIDKEGGPPEIGVESRGSMKDTELSLVSKYITALPLQNTGCLITWDIFMRIRVQKGRFGNCLRVSQ